SFFEDVLRRAPLHTPLYAEQYLGHRNVIAELGEEVEQQKPPSCPVVVKANAADKTRMACIQGIQRPYQAAVGRDGRLSSPNKITSGLDRSEEHRSNRA